MGLPRKRNYAGRWDSLIDKSTKCLNRLLEIASKKKRNYIIDQVRCMFLQPVDQCPLHVMTKSVSGRPWKKWDEVIQVISSCSDSGKLWICFLDSVLKIIVYGATIPDG